LQTAPIFSTFDDKITVDFAGKFNILTVEKNDVSPKCLTCKQLTAQNVLKYFFRLVADYVSKFSTFATWKFNGDKFKENQLCI
jgi:hypothetical protein